MKIYAKLHSPSHNSHSIQYLPGLRNTPKPCQDFLIKPILPVANRGNWTKLDFAEAGKNMSGWLHPQETHCQVREQFWRLNGKHCAEREQRKQSRKHHLGITSINRYLPGPKDTWRNEDVKFVQMQRKKKRKWARQNLIYTSSITEQKKYFQSAYVLILSQILHKLMSILFLFMFSNPLYNILRYLDNDLSSIVLHPTYGITLKLTF